MGRGTRRYNRGWNSAIADIPIRVWDQALGIVTELDFNADVILGSRILDYTGVRTKLEMRAKKDPRKYQALQSLDNEHNVPINSLIFLSFGNNDRIIYAYDPETGKIHRLVHCTIDEAGGRLHQNERRSLNQILIGESQGLIAEELPPPRRISSTFPAHPTLPRTSEMTTYDVLLPPTHTQLGISVMEDQTTGIPYIVEIPSISPLYEQVNSARLSSHYFCGYLSLPCWGIMLVSCQEHLQHQQNQQELLFVRKQDRRPGIRRRAVVVAHVLCMMSVLKGLAMDGRARVAEAAILWRELETCCNDMHASSG